jgi:hypothetical protein
LKKGGEGSTLVIKDSAYYFFIRCNEHPEIDAQFQTFLDDAIKGSTEAIDLDSSDSSSVENNKEASKPNKRVNTNSSGKRKATRASSFESMVDTMDARTELMFQEMKCRNLKQEKDSEKLVDSSALMGLMNSVKTKIQVYMYQKNDEKLAECTQQLSEYEEQFRKIMKKEDSA